jgi:ribulose-5-phosphate 4-epimerase/fuculose-1-phosphate aldolase
MLVKPDALGFDEVTASCLVKVPIGTGVQAVEGVQTAGYNIHCGVLEARSDLNASLHVHTDAGMAVAAQQDGLLPITQTALRFYKHLGMHAFEGFASALEERQRIGKDLGPFKAMLMLNHGLLTAGRSVCEAFVLMKFLVTACEVQLRVQASGASYNTPVEETCLNTARAWNAPQRPHSAEWSYLLRTLDKIDPSYKS